jgi:flagellar hook assembly protein FlgD
MGSCYDTLASSTPVLWNSNYTNELIYPNPFAQTTRITFDVRNPAPVDLFITDINGKPVKLLLAQQFISSGSYDVMWDGRDHSGSPLPAGTYYYNIRSRFGSESGQIILIR